MQNEVLTKIKSKETISVEHDPNESGSFLESYASPIIVVLALLIGFIGYKVGLNIVSETENTGFEVTLSAFPHRVAPGESPTIQTLISNEGSDRIDSFSGSLDIPGFGLSWLERANHASSFLLPGDRKSYNQIIHVNNEQVPGTYYAVYNTIIWIKGQTFLESHKTTIKVILPSPN